MKKTDQRSNLQCGRFSLFLRRFSLFKMHLCNTVEESKSVFYLVGFRSLDSMIEKKKKENKTNKDDDDDEWRCT